MAEASKSAPTRAASSIQGSASSPFSASQPKHEAPTSDNTLLPTADSTAAPVEHEAAPPHNVSPAAEPKQAPQTPTPTQNIPIDAAYEEDDADSAFDSGSIHSDTTSLRSDITRYRFENNRRYHSYKDGTYWGPNDEKQNNQLDIAHHLYLLTLGGKLFLAPIGDNPQNVLDVGTGTGIWAMDFADQYPSAQVIGFDLSAIQPGWVPPNLQFEINDACAPDWDYAKNSFDFIHVRAMYGSVADWPAFYQQALA